MTIRAVIFDLGGVILRTEDRVPRTKLAERLGMTYEELDAFVFGCESSKEATLGEKTVDAHWAFIADYFGLDAAGLNDFTHLFWGGDQVDTKLVDYIRSLHGRFKTGLLSNAWSDLRQVVEEEFRIIDAFDEIVISAEVGLAKPDPHIYELAVERLGVAPDEAAFVDDMLPNVEAAREAGLHAIHFQNTEQVILELEQLWS